MTTKTNTDPLNAFGTFAQAVATAGTRVQFPPHPCKSATVKALSTNTGIIYIGGSEVSSSVGFPLSPGDSASADISNTDLMWADASVNGDAVRVLYANSP